MAALLGAPPQFPVARGERVEREGGAERLAVGGGHRRRGTEQVGQQEIHLPQESGERARAVPLGEGELDGVPPAGFAGAERLADGEDRAAAGGEQPLQGELRGSVEVTAVGRHAVEMAVRGRVGAEQRGFDFQVPAGLQELAQPADDGGAAAERLRRRRGPPVGQVFFRRQHARFRPFDSFATGCSGQAGFPVRFPLAAFRPGSGRPPRSRIPIRHVGQAFRTGIPIRTPTERSGRNADRGSRRRGLPAPRRPTPQSLRSSPAPHRRRSGCRGAALRPPRRTAAPAPPRRFPGWRSWNRRWRCRRGCPVPSPRP